MKIRLQTPPKPDQGRLTFFVDPTKTPRQKDANDVSTAIGLTGEPVTLNEGSAPAEDADGVWLYSKDVSGISELFVMDGDGNEIQVTDGGSLSPGVGGGGGQFWPTQVGSSEFDSGGAATPAGAFTVPTGLILAPTPGVASIIHFRATIAVMANADGTYGPQNLSGAVLLLVGYVAFNLEAGTPDVRRKIGMIETWGTVAAGPFATVDGATEDGCTVLPSGELVLNLVAANDLWLTGRVAATSLPLPANLIDPA